VSASPSPSPEVLAWWEAGEAHLRTLLDTLGSEDLDGPSLLPGWPRRMVVAHLARNADALGNLLHWARTGQPTPMYPSREARDAAIAESAAQDPPTLAADCVEAAGRFAEALRSLPPAAWGTEVTTAQGRSVPASTVPWLRCREVWVHAVDLAVGTGFSDLPEPLLLALLEEVSAAWQRSGRDPGLRFLVGDRHIGPGPRTLRGRLPALVGWATGRLDASGLESEEPIPSPPPWP
jgi:maleylpyruvate isomerase